MTDELYGKISAFRTAMCLYKEMLCSGIISKDEYKEIESIVAENMGLSLCTIFR